MVYCDLNPSVVMWTSEYPIRYYSRTDGKHRRYFVDFILKLSDGRMLAVEIKPHSQTIPPKNTKRKRQNVYLEEMTTWQVNQDKWSAAKEWCRKINAEFLILTERELGIANRTTSKKT